MKDGGKRKPQDQSPTQLAGEDLPGDSCGTLVADAKKVHSLKKSISSERLNGYLSRGASDENILSHYAWNIALCESLYPSLQCLEVVLRNSLYEAVANRKGNNWISNERNPWLGRNELENIAKAKERLTERGKTTISNSDIVAEMHFGFWAGLFDVRFERAQVLWPQFLKPSFPYMPKKHRTRREISATINDIRHLRNASFHHLIGKN